MDYDLLFADVPVEVIAAITSVLPLGITVMVALVGISIAITVFGKFGVRR